MIRSHGGIQMSPEKSTPAFTRLASPGAILPGRGISFANPYGRSEIRMDTPLQILKESPFRHR